MTRSAPRSSSGSVVPAIAKRALRAREKAWTPGPGSRRTTASKRCGTTLVAADADLVVLPAELAEPSVLERLRGDRLDDESLSNAPTPVLVVDDDGNRIVG